MSAQLVTCTPTYSGRGPSWKLIAEGHRRQDLGRQDPEVGDAEQDVDLLLDQCSGESGSGRDQRHVLLPGPALDPLVPGGDRNDRQPGGGRQLRALHEQRFVADEGAPDPRGDNASVGARGRGHCPGS
jgi:hypothetical protein